MKNREIKYAEKHIHQCANGNFKIFPFFQMKSQDTDYRRAYERYFQVKFKTKLNKQ